MRLTTGKRVVTSAVLPGQALSRLPCARED
jgi:hypothetical protein